MRKMDWRDRLTTAFCIVASVSMYLHNEDGGWPLILAALLITRPPE